ncbi:MAG: hypothetical protein AAGF94_15890 [Pseudomonadota bacterium]
MYRPSIGPLVIAVTTVFLPTLAQASSEMPHCGAFEVTREKPSIVIIDNYAEGLSVGDRRIGSYDLIGADGSKVGQLLFESSVAAETDGGHRMIGKAHVVFDDGIIHYPVTYELADASKPQAPPGIAAFDYHVTGGVGAYEGATGIARHLTLDDGTRVFRYELAC